MNKELRDDLEHLIICEDKSITQDLRDDIKMTLDYVDELEKENDNLKYHLNDVVFDNHNVDVELSARLLRRLGYCGFDEKRKVYLNKHNKEPLWQEEKREKTFYLKDDELDDYTKQLEYKIDKLIEYNQKIYDTSIENERLMAKINLDILRGEDNE